MHGRQANGATVNCSSSAPDLDKGGYGKATTPPPDLTVDVETGGIIADGIFSEATVLANHAETTGAKDNFVRGGMRNTFVPHEH